GRGGSTSTSALRVLWKIAVPPPAAATTRTEAAIHRHIRRWGDPARISSPVVAPGSDLEDELPGSGPAAEGASSPARAASSSRARWAIFSLNRLETYAASSAVPGASSAL